MLARLPRVLVTAPRSGTGKTTVGCALMGALAARGMRVLSCKCGPDYIDPTFHAQVGAVAHVNLDPFFQGEDLLRDILGHAGRGCDIACIEGAMGYYDGISTTVQASAWDVARITDAPAVLVLDGRGACASLAAQVLGFVRLRQPSHIAGVILNNTSSMLVKSVAPFIEGECGVRVLGCLPHDEQALLPSRHLGLVCAQEVADVEGRLRHLAALAQDNLDIDAIVGLAQAAPALERDGAWPPAPIIADGAKRPVVAVARDEAFSFYYSEELEQLQALGAELAFFSPLRDAGLPQGASGLILGGGYPELHARQLAQNSSMLGAVRAAVAAGMPTIAECGGFLYLHEWLEDADGQAYPLVGAVRGRAAKTARQGRFGYIELTARDAGLLGPAGTTVRGHEFHRWDCEDPGCDLAAQKPCSARAWQAGHHSGSHYLGFPHLYLPSAPDVARRFVLACREWAGNHGEGAAC
jgi:cobyrinic acid a,c-diamide synthase